MPSLTTEPTARWVGIQELGGDTHLIVYRKRDWCAAFIATNRLDMGPVGKATLAELILRHAKADGLLECRYVAAGLSAGRLAETEAALDAVEPQPVGLWAWLWKLWR